MNDKQSLPSTRLELYRDENNKWRWRLISKADVRAISSQGYVSKQGCLIALSRVRSIMQDAELIEL